MRAELGPRARTVAYWAATLLIAAELAVGGVTDILRLPPFFPVLLQLGYPAYVGTVIGIWKVLGTAAVLAPRFPRLKEWAYAGTVFDLTGAAASGLAAGQGAAALAGPLPLLAVAAASWALRPPSRRLLS